MRAIVPVSSAMPMILPGGIRPFSGWLRRISASKPAICPSARLTIGCSQASKWSSFSPASMHCSISWRSREASSMLASKSCRPFLPSCLRAYMAISALSKRSEAFSAWAG
ncbi:hypothetical protein D9M72_422900 [compost metagenome]